MATLLRMIATRPISAKRLHRCRLRFADGVQWRASVFPFFERSGEVQALLIIRYDAPELYAASYRADWIQYSHPWSVKRVLSPSTDLAPLTKGDTLNELARVWHYDPWWVLREPPFTNHVATAALQTTNCVDRMPRETRSLAFDPNLSHVHSITVHEGDHARTRLWETAWLPERFEETYAVGMAPVRGRWVLDPIWMREHRIR
jgi:hypothetical protein